MFTRQQFNDSKCSFREYFSQFVNDCNIQIVKKYIGVEAIEKSTDEHFNDIPLKKWDSLPIAQVCDKLKRGGDYLTLADKVCIMKECARQIKEAL